MAEKEISLKKIPESFVKANGVQSLADRPNQNTFTGGGRGGLSPVALKAAFDTLAIKLVETVNTIIDYSTGGHVCVPWENDRNTDLNGLVEILKNEMLEVIQVPEQISTTRSTTALRYELENYRKLFSDISEKIDAIDSMLTNFINVSEEGA